MREELARITTQSATDPLPSVTDTTPTYHAGDRSIKRNGKLVRNRKMEKS